MAKDGLAGFWRGIRPALVLVINPVIQYTVFEQLKNALIAARAAKLPRGKRGPTSALLTDWDFFILGAFSKLGMCRCDCFELATNGTSCYWDDVPVHVRGRVLSSAEQADA